MIVRRLLLASMGLAVALPVAGYVYQQWASARDRTSYPPTGSMYEVDGLALHLDCRGEGIPLVVLEAGLGAGSSSWSGMHDRLAHSARVCAYDRPGMGWSDPLGRTASREEVADRLHGLLRVADLTDPRILVGVSAGGVYVRSFHARYPEDVVGMILVDSSHEQQGHRLPELPDAPDMQGALRLCSWLQPFGLIRALGLVERQFDAMGVPNRGTGRAAGQLQPFTHGCAELLKASVSFDGDVKSEKPPGSLGDLPLTVLSQGDEPKAMPEFGMTLAQARRQRKVWDELQEELTALSSRGKHVIVRESGHVIQVDKPEVIVDAVGEMVRDFRARSSQQ